MSRTPRREEILERLHKLLEELGPQLADQIVVVGGSAPATFTFEIEGIDVRHTEDVDMVLRGAYREWSAFQSELEGRDFEHVVDAHVSKMVKGTLEVDIMPDADPRLAANRWYAEAFANREFSKTVGLHIISPTYFLATKFEAFLSPDRLHHGDPLTSRDIEDIILTLFAMPSLRITVASGKDRVHRFIRYQLHSQIANHSDALFIIQGHLYSDDASQAYADPLLHWMRSLPDKPI